MWPLSVPADIEAHHVITHLEPAVVPEQSITTAQQLQLLAVLHFWHKYNRLQRWVGSDGGKSHGRNMDIFRNSDNRAKSAAI